MVNDSVLDNDACEEDLVHVPGIKVLVADLFPVIADTCAMILNQSGFSAFPAHSVSEAVGIANENPIDLEFIELLSGETDAIDAAERILAVRPYCRIIIWTGRREPVLSWVRLEAEERFGGCELIQKPVRPQDFIRILRGETVSYEPYWVSPGDCLRGCELHEYLREARRVMLEIIEERKSQELIV